MNKTQEALKMAIKRLEKSNFELQGIGNYSCQIYNDKAIETCKEALEKCEQAEPVAWMIWWDDREWLFTGDREDFDIATKNKFPITPLYTAPQDPSAEIAQLKAHINELRKAAENYILEGETSLAELEKALASTPQQSLQNVIDETIERCAKVCGSRDGSWADCEWNDAVRSCEEAIRALKGKQNES